MGAPAVPATPSEESPRRRRVLFALVVAAIVGLAATTAVNAQPRLGTGTDRNDIAW